MKEPLYKFPKLNIENIDSPITFQFQFQREEKDFYISYKNEEHEGYEDYFNDFSDFFYRLHLHYESRIEKEEDIEQKRYILDEYSLTIIESQITLSKWFSRVNKEIEVHVVKYEKYIEIEKELLLSIKPKQKKSSFTEKQKILILEYTGLLKTFKDLDISYEQEAQIISAITDMHLDNAKKYLRNRHKAIEKGSDPKTRANLEGVKKFFINNKLPESLINEIQEDIFSIK